MNVGSLRRSRTAPNRETLSEIRGIVAVRTSGLRQGGLRCNFDRLSEDDQRRAVELVKEADYQTWSWQRLGDRKRKELEKLIEKASGTPGIFKDTRAVEEIRAMTESARVAEVRKPLTRQEERGVFSEIAAGIEGRSLEAADVALIAVVVTAFVSGKATAPRTRVERVGEMSVLVVEDANMGLFGGEFDAEQQLAPRWKQNLQWLEQIDWFTVDRRGKEWHISAGPRLRNAMAGLRSAA